MFRYPTNKKKRVVTLNSPTESIILPRDRVYSSKNVYARSNNVSKSCDSLEKERPGEFDEMHWSKVTKNSYYWDCMHRSTGIESAYQWCQTHIVAQSYTS